MLDEDKGLIHMQAFVSCSAATTFLQHRSWCIVSQEFTNGCD